MEAIVPEDAKIKNRYCSPKISNKEKSCLSYELLLLLIQLYNNSHQDKIVLPQEGRKNKTILWKALQMKLKNQCGDNEVCWIEQPWVQNSKTKLERNFRPRKPNSWYKNPNEWLNTYDILDVMKQYEESDNTFAFIGVFPVDFAAMNSQRGTCIVQEMCKLNMKESWAKGTKRIGIVFNMDKHDQSGSHWTALYIGLCPKRRNFGVFYYDSVAMNPPKEIVKFMKQIQQELLKLHEHKKNHNLEYRINRVRRQYKNSNCGVFSMLFLILMLYHKFDIVCEKMGYDDDVQRYRDILYRPSSSK